MAPPLARLSQDRFRQTPSPVSASTDTSRANVPYNEGQPTDQRQFQQYEGNVVCVMDGNDAPIGRFSP